MNLQAVPQGQRGARNGQRYDLWLIGTIAVLLSIGLVMSVSTSVSVAERRELEALHYFWRQLIAAGVGLSVAAVLVCVPLEKFATEPVRINKIDGCWLSSYKDKDKVKQRQCLC